jgi:Na+-translocating ferredoxin:NAD+ oxidoreductase subunit B
MIAYDFLILVAVLLVLELGIAWIWARRTDHAPPTAHVSTTTMRQLEPGAAMDVGDTSATPALIDAIDAILPQTQCTQCSYTGCRPYAEAIASGEADIDQCPPGGVAGIVELAALLGREIKPLNPANGIDKPRVVAWVDEAICIGCTKCIQACPVDAIVGAAKLMHTVLTDECTGCELCIAPCPVDCIHLTPVPDAVAERAEQLQPERRRAARARADHWRRRLRARQSRLARDDAERNARLAARRGGTGGNALPDAVQAAIARAQARQRPDTVRDGDDPDASR